MPKPYPREFREDVIRVARNREPGVRIRGIAKDFGIIRVVSDELAAPLPTSRTASSRARRRREHAELREAKQRIRLLEQENEVLRRAAAYLSQANLPGK